MRLDLFPAFLDLVFYNGFHFWIDLHDLFIKIPLVVGLYKQEFDMQEVFVLSLLMVLKDLIKYGLTPVVSTQSFIRNTEPEMSYKNF